MLTSRAFTVQRSQMKRCRQLVSRRNDCIQSKFSGVWLYFLFVRCSYYPQTYCCMECLIISREGFSSVYAERCYALPTRSRRRAALAALTSGFPTSEMQEFLSRSSRTVRPSSDESFVSDVDRRLLVCVVRFSSAEVSLRLFICTFVETTKSASTAS